MAKMRAAEVETAKGKFRIAEREVPQPGRSQVRIKVQASGICHSDSFTKEGLWPGIQFPRVPGHEIAGIVDEIGDDVSAWKVGDRVGVGWHGGHCGHCERCRRGDFQLCQFARSRASPTTVATPTSWSCQPWRRRGSRTGSPPPTPRR